MIDPERPGALVASLQVAIAGMHRSGTSLVARLLNLCGVDLGPDEDINVAGPDNPDGFWENERFKALNEQLLAGAGAAWDLPDAVHDLRLREASTDALQTGATNLVQGFESSTAWGWKDPRTSLTLPFWLGLLPDLRVVVCVRNPLEVAKSLERRNFLSRTLSLHLWREYNRRILEHAPAERRIVTHFDAYFTDPEKELRRVLGWLGLAHVKPAAIDDAVQAVRGTLRHHRLTRADLARQGVPDDVIEMYRGLCDEAGWQDDPNASTPTATPRQDEAQRLQAEIDQLRTERQALERNAELLNGELTELEKMLADQAGANLTLQAELEDERAQARIQSEVRKNLEQRAEFAKAETAQLQQQLEQRIESGRLLRESLQQRAQIEADLRAQIQRHAERNQQLLTEGETLREQAALVLGELESAAQATEAQRNQAEETRSALEVQLAELETLLATHAENNAGLQESLEQVQARSAELDVEITGHKREARRLRQQAARARLRVSDLTAQLEEERSRTSTQVGLLLNIQQRWQYAKDQLATQQRELEQRTESAAALRRSLEAQQDIAAALRRQIDRQSEWNEELRARADAREHAYKRLQHESAQTQQALRDQNEGVRRQLEEERELARQELGRVRSDLQAENERSLSELAEERDIVARLENDADTLFGRISIMEFELAHRDAQLDEIKTSTAWGLVEFLWGIRQFLVPKGGKRDHVLYAWLCAVRWVGRLGRGTGDGDRELASDVEGTLTLPSLAAAGESEPLTGQGDSSLDAQNDMLSDFPAYPEPGKYDVIVFPIIDWHFRYQRPQQIAAHLADAGHRVLYVRTTLLERDRPRLKAIRRQVLDVQLPGPEAMVIYRDSIEDELLDRLVAAFDDLRRQLHLAQAVCVVDLPFWAPLAFRLRQRFGWKVVYDCMDDHAGFQNITVDVLDKEHQLAADSDLVLTSAQHLYDTHLKLNPNCALVPNATDFQHFRFAPPVPPPEIAGLSGPIVGYYGAIADWFDTHLVARLAKARPEWNFVLIGNTYRSEIEALDGLPNVHILGEMPYHRLPGFLHRFDVCFIPFKRSPLTDATNPVKLFEFLSAGKPIVATYLTELARYGEYVQQVSDEAEWLPALEQALEPAQPAEVQRRVDFARGNTWDERAKVIHERVAQLFPMVSIVVVTYNNVDYTRSCLDSIYTKTGYSKFEVIVVDNASQDATPELLEEFAARHANFKFVLNNHNEGFARANNMGIERAQGEIIVLLNNDTVVTPAWLSGLVRHLRDEKLGLVGPVTNWAGNESRIDVDYASLAEMDEFAQRYTNAHFGESIEMRMLAFFCVAFRRDVLDTIGTLDERFGVGMFEDDDYAMRVRNAGYRIACVEDVFVHHWGRASFSKLEQDSYRQLFEENKRKFEEKWGSWQPHVYRR